MAPAIPQAMGCVFRTVIAGVSSIQVPVMIAEIQHLIVDVHWTATADDAMPSVVPVTTEDHVANRVSDAVAAMTAMALPGLGRINRERANRCDSQECENDAFHDQSPKEVGFSRIV
ncbi:MAG: hypothetical protein ACE5KM_23395 [Planctomycetaceae bacterium]